MEQQSNVSEGRCSQFIPNSSLGFQNSQLRPILSETESDSECNKNGRQHKQRNYHSNPQQPFNNNAIKQNTELSSFFNKLQNQKNNSNQDLIANGKRSNISDDYNNRALLDNFKSSGGVEENNLEDFKNWNIYENQNSGSIQRNTTNRMTYIKRISEPSQELKEKYLSIVVLLLGTLSASSLGPFFMRVDPPEQSQILKSIYRQQVMVILNFFLVIYEYKKTKSNKYTKTLYSVNNLCNKNVNIKILFAAIFWTFYIASVPLSIAQENMEIYSAQIFFGIYPSLIVLYKIVKKMRLSYQEYLGFSISALCYIYIFVSSKSSYGCVISIFGGIMFTLYMKIQESYSDYYPELMMHFINSIWSSIILSVLAYFTISSNMGHISVFSDPKDVILYFVMALFSGVIASFCFSYAKQNLNKQIIQSFRGSFPFFSMIIAWVFGLQPFESNYLSIVVMILVIFFYALIAEGKSESENDDFFMKRGSQIEAIKSGDEENYASLEQYPRTSIRYSKI